MLLNPRQRDRLDRLSEQLRLAQTVTPDLVSAVVADACVRIPALNSTGTAAVRLRRLIESCAWIEAALAVIELELPQWKLRRLLHEDGQWFCSLSRQPNLPVELDDTADAVHEVLPLAILSAFIEARRHSAAAAQIRSRSVPRVRPSSGYAVCCDDFG
jgi:hypothetical protein